MINGTRVYMLSGLRFQVEPTMDERADKADQDDGLPTLSALDDIVDPASREDLEETARW